MNRFRSVLLIPPIGLTSAASSSSPRHRARWLRHNPNTRNHEETKPTGRAVVLCQVPTQAAPTIDASESKIGRSGCPKRPSARPPFVYVRAPKHEQPACAPAHPRKELREEVRDDHAQACLNVLQREVLCVAPAVRAEARPHACHDLEERPERRHDSIHVQVGVVAESRARVNPTNHVTAWRCAWKREAEGEKTDLPIASASSLARPRVSALEFSVPM